MWDLDEFRETVRLFCDHAMVAAHRYWVLTEWGGKSCPEYFIEARITNRLGKRASRTAWASKRIPMNLEIPSDSDLAVVWHRKTQAGKFERDPRLCDLQARSRQTPAPGQEGPAPLGLIELKRHSDVSGDRAKLKRMLRHFPGCFVATIGIAKRPDDDWLDEKAKKEGPNLVFGCQRRMEGHTFHAFGFIHENPAREEHQPVPGAGGATA